VVIRDDTKHLPLETELDRDMSMYSKRVSEERWTFNNILISKRIYYFSFEGRPKEGF